MARMRLLMVMSLLGLTSIAEAGFDRSNWLLLYDSAPESGPKSIAVAYVYGMANGLTIAEAMDCTGVELSGDEIAATVADIVRRGIELNLAVPMALVVHRCRATPNGVFKRSEK